MPSSVPLLQTVLSPLTLIEVAICTIYTVHAYYETLRGRGLKVVAWELMITCYGLRSSRRFYTELGLLVLGNRVISKERALRGI